MKISTRNNPAVRLISVGTIGVLVVIGMFAMLYALVDVPFDARPVDRVRLPDFTAIPPPSPPTVPPPRERIDRPQPTEFPPVTDLVDNDDSSENDKPGRPTGPDVFTWNPPPGNGGLENIQSGGTDQDVIAVVRIPPFYPVRAETRGIEGWVRVRFTISPNGSVRDARVIAAEPEGEFEEAALTAIERWRYNPRVVNGVAVDRVGVETVIQFQLTD
jgi:protein TonB